MKDFVAPPVIPPKRILVVDDAPHVARTIQAMLAYFGHEVETSADGEEALGKFAPGTYDLVVTDYSMPRMNGIDLAHAIRKQAAGQLIVLVTGFAFSMAARHPGPLPVDLVIGKPFSLAEFREALAALFAKAGMA